MLRILQEAGVKCGIETKHILTDCPTQKFCAIQTEQMYGEICVRGIEEVVLWQPVLIILAFLFGVLVGLVIYKAKFLTKIKRYFKGL
ncbi:MAG: hypothetical protein ACE5KE_05095 [Methanosarcinales archaeon]